MPLLCFTLCPSPNRHPGSQCYAHGLLSPRVESREVRRGTFEGWGRNTLCAHLTQYSCFSPVGSGVSSVLPTLPTPGKVSPIQGSDRSRGPGSRGPGSDPASVPVSLRALIFLPLNFICKVCSISPNAERAK